MLAYILISLKDCDEKAVLEDIKEIAQVREAHVLFGEWDIIAKIDVENTDALGSFMMDEIRSRKNIKLTSTLIVAK
jgi:Lrp/AsnC family transcriptional regulator, leucine-responsive regulatory protein